MNLIGNFFLLSGLRLVVRILINYPDIMINAICPGYCATDMSSHRGTRSASDGASNAIHVIQLPFMQHTGEFFQNWKLSKW